MVSSLIRCKPRECFINLLNCDVQKGAIGVDKAMFDCVSCRRLDWSSAL